MTAQSLRHEYGDRVRVEYADLADEQTREKYASALEEIKKKYLRFPVTEVDNRLISSGFIDYWEIVSVVEQRLKEQGLAERKQQAQED